MVTSSEIKRARANERMMILEEARIRAAEKRLRRTETLNERKKREQINQIGNVFSGVLRIKAPKIVGLSSERKTEIREAFRNQERNAGITNKQIIEAQINEIKSTEKRSIFFKPSQQMRAEMQGEWEDRWL